MALKADRYEFQTDISFFSDSAVATRGGVVVHDGTTASGAAMDQGVNKVMEEAVTADSIPVGILLNDIVNKDLTRTHINHYKDEVQLGGKVTVLRKGWVVTNRVTHTPAISVGDVAYACHITKGNIRGDSPGNSGDLAIGRFLTGKDEDGYCKVEVNLPNLNAGVNVS